MPRPAKSARMEDALRAVLGLVLALSAVAKTLRRRSACEGLVALGLPALVAAPGLALLVVAEALAAALLLTPAPAALAGSAAAGLGLVFCAVLLRARAEGLRRLRCGCFGSAQPRPLWLLAARAAAVALAGLALAAGLVPAGVPSRGALLACALAALGVAVVGLGVAVAQLARQVGQLHLALAPRSALELEEEGPPLGSAAPALDGLRRQGGELVLFGSGGCRLCRELEPALRAVAALRALVVRPVGAEQEPSPFAGWNVPGTPYVVHLEDGIVAAKGLVNTREQLDGLVTLGRARAAGLA